MSEAAGGPTREASGEAAGGPSRGASGEAAGGPRRDAAGEHTGGADRGLSADKVRDEVRHWIESQWNPDMPLARWRVLLADSGWGCPTWPKRWCGRGLWGA